MIDRFRRLGAVILSIGCICLVAACGSSSKSSSGSSGTLRSAPGAPAGFKLTSAQRSCLRGKGVQIPTGRAGARAAGGNTNSGPPPNGGPPKGKRPKGAGGRPPGGAGAGGFAQNSKQRAALKACGVTLPSVTPSATTG